MQGEWGGIPFEDVILGLDALKASTYSGTVDFDKIGLVGFG